ncbi:MAG: alpha/beta hydrolase fold domain-containing protein, partial [Solirubrobacteraceae bacterium]
MAPAALSPNLGQRLESLSLRGLMSLPGALQVRLSGRPPVRIDGDTLAPDIQLMLALLELRGEASPTHASPVELRRIRRRGAAVAGGSRIPVGAVRDLELETAIPLRARHYVPDGRSEVYPLLVFFHGGGFVFGDLETHDGFCRMLVRHSGAQVLAVDYRLAPEHPFPAAIEDARAALAWAFANAASL